MIKEALEYLIGLKRPETINVEKHTYYLDEYKRFSPPIAYPITVHSLQGLLGLIDCHQTEGQFQNPIIHVLDHETVQVFSFLDLKFRSRETLCVAKRLGDIFPFGKYIPIEEFIIKIKSLFVQDKNTELILRKIGSITQDAKMVTLDDGVSQSTTARKGIAGVENIIIPSLIELLPYRTFVEVLQPASDFVLRVRSGDTGPQVALFEADGGAWRVRAIKNISSWLLASSSGEVPVIS